MKSKPLPSRDRVKELLDYNPETGVFTWKVNRNNRQAKAGSTAGCYDKTTGVRIRVDKQECKAHRLAWLYVHGEDPGPLYVDHINRDNSDNRLSNLRLATHQQNLMNQDCKGYFWESTRQKFRAMITVDYKHIYLGDFDCPLLARLAYIDAKRKYNGEFSPV